MENNNPNDSSRPDRKLMERNRRTQMKALFSKLNSLLPHHNSRAPTSLPDQLHEAAKYIKKLQMDLERVKEKKDMLMRGGRWNNARSRSNEPKSPEIQIHEMGSSLVEKLKDLCLKQREEIKSLKSAILFSDVMNSQLQDLVEKQGLELTQAKQLIPTLQRQVTSLTGQLQCLAEDIAQVKADKYSSKACHQQHGSYTRSPRYDRMFLGYMPVESIKRNVDWAHVVVYDYHLPTRENFTGVHADYD